MRKGTSWLYQTAVPAVKRILHASCLIPQDPLPLAERLGGLPRIEDQMSRLVFLPELLAEKAKEPARTVGVDCNPGILAAFQAQ